MFTTSFIAVASLLVSFFPLPEKVEYTVAEIAIAKKATLGFSIGQFELHRSGTTTPIRLLKTLDDRKVTMLSESFNVALGDSIYFRRTMAITGSGATKPVDKSMTIANFADSYARLESASQNKGVKLTDAVFNKESHVKVITDLMYEGTDQLIASLDTLTVMRNSNGYLKAYTAALKPDAVKLPLQNIDPSKPVVIKVWIHMLLPESTKFTINTKSQLRDKKPYNVVSINSNTVVPGYSKKRTN